MKIKTRKQREKEYKSQYGHVSTDKWQRLKDELGDKLNDELFDAAKARIEDVQNKVEYNELKFIFYEIPIQSHRPRTHGKSHSMYVPNAKANSNAIENFIKSIKDEITIIATPMRIELNAYLPMPKGIKPIEVLLYETENDYAIGKPDFDNILKAYCDMCQKHIILDDDLVVSCSFNKYFSLKPRVEFSIIYINGVASKYAYKRITSRKTFKDFEGQIECKLLTKPYRSKKSKKGGK